MMWMSLYTSIKLDVDGDLARQQKLLLVELFRHLVLKGLVEKLSDDFDERKHEEQRKDERRRGQQVQLFQAADNVLKHKLIYFETRGKVKGIEKPGEKREEEEGKTKQGRRICRPCFFIQQASMQTIQRCLDGF
jgi:hypothetical protein